MARVVRIVLSLIAIVALSTSAWAQTPDVQIQADTITSNGDAVTLQNLPSGRGSAAITVSNYCSCTLVIEGRGYNGGDWEAISGAPTISADGIYSVSAAGLFGVRVRASAWASTTTTITIRVSSAGGGSGGSGSGAAGDVTSNGANIATEATQALNLSALNSIYTDIHDLVTNKIAPDAVHANAVIATGPGIQCEGKDIDAGALANVVTEGQSARVACVLNGSPIVVLANEAGTLDIGALMQASLALLDDAIFTDEAAYTYTTSKGVVVGGVAESTTDAIADGLFGALMLDTARRLVVTPAPSTYGGLSIYRSIDLDEGTGEVIKNAPGQLYALWVTNTSTATRFIKIYDATSCTIGTGTPVITAAIPGNASDDVTGNLTAGGYGITFATGMCFGAVTGVADNDTGAPGANDVVANAFYK